MKRSSVVLIALALISAFAGFACALAAVWWDGLELRFAVTAVLFLFIAFAIGTYPGLGD